MNNEDFVSYKSALRLKKLGFHFPCLFYYVKEDAPEGCVWITTSTITPEDWNSDKENEPVFLQPVCSAPNLAQAQKWLREKKGIYVYPEINMLKKWFAKAVDMSKNEDLIWDDTMFDSYESALSAGIEAALKLIEEGEK